MKICKKQCICACIRVQSSHDIYMIVIIMIMFLICAINMALTCVNMHNFVECSFLSKITDRKPPPKTPWTAPRWPKMATKMTQDGHMMAPRWPLDGPQGALGPCWPQDGPRWPQGDPRWPQDGPKMASRWSTRRSWRWLPVDDVVQK